MSGVTLKTRAPKQAAWRMAWLGTAVLLVLLALLSIGGYYLHWANRVSPLPAENRVYPEPNGLDQLLAAARGLPDHLGSDPLADPVTADLATLRTELAPQAAKLRQLRAAVALPFLNPPIRSADHPPTYTFDFLRAAWMFAAKSRVELAEGRAASAMDWALDAVELGSRAGRGGPAYVHEQARECGARGAAMAERCVPKLTERETRAAAQRLERLMTQFSPFSEVMAEERRFRVAARHRVLTGADPAWVGGRAPSPYAMWEARTRIFFSPKRVILSRLDREYAAMEAFSRLEWPARPRPRMARPPIEWQLAGQAGDTCATSDAQLRLLRLQLALHAHHLRTGNYPADLRELSGLPDRTVRLDPFTGQPFCYTRIGTGYRLYSLGRDARDDGGDPQRDVVAGELRSLL